MLYFTVYFSASSPVFFCGARDCFAPGSSPGECVHCTCLGFHPRAPCGTEACRRLWRMQAGEGRESQGAGRTRDYASSPEDAGRRRSGIARSGQGPRLCEFPGAKQRGWKQPGEVDVAGFQRNKLSRVANVIILMTLPFRGNFFLDQGSLGNNSVVIAFFPATCYNA